MNKTQRLLEIRKIIQKNKIGSQEELMAVLNKKGFESTQATLSRDLKFLKAGKMPDAVKGMIYVLPDKNNRPAPYTRPVKNTIFSDSGYLSIEYTGNMAVIKTIPGFASSLAYKIDGMNAFEIIGTIAGDDTILVVGREGISRPALVQSLRPIIS